MCYFFFSQSKYKFPAKKAYTNSADTDQKQSEQGLPGLLFRIL